jgi:hypothetical protein
MAFLFLRHALIFCGVAVVLALSADILLFLSFSVALWTSTNRPTNRHKLRRKPRFGPNPMSLPDVTARSGRSSVLPAKSGFQARSLGSGATSPGKLPIITCIIGKFTRPALSGEQFFGVQCCRRTPYVGRAKINEVGKVDVSLADFPLFQICHADIQSDLTT